MIKKARHANLALTTAIALSMSVGSVLAHGVVDQSNLTTGGAQLILVHQPIGQEFTPAVSTLVGVDIVFRGSSTPGSDTVTVNIRHRDISSPILATTSRFVDQCPFVPPYNCIEHFDFPSPVTVIPGDTYVIEVQVTMPIHAWQGGPGDYPGGAKIIQGVRRPELPDYGFQTYHSTDNELEICLEDLGVCESDLAECTTSSTVCRDDLAQAGEDAAVCVSDLEEGRSGLQEILRLLNLPPGQRWSNYACTGELCEETTAAINRLLGPAGQGSRRGERERGGRR